MKTRRYNLEQFDILEIDFQPKYKERKIEIRRNEIAKSHGMD